jgi:hypothetical protein
VTAPIAPTLDGLEQPLPPILQVRGKDYPMPGDPDPKFNDFVKRKVAETEQDALQRYKDATFNILFASGKQHTAWKSSKRQWDDVPDADEKVTMNYVLPILRSRVQRLTSSEISWRGIPEDNSQHARDRTKLGVNVIKARWAASKMEGKLRQAVLQSSMTGVVALKSFWNANIGPLTPAKMYFPVPDEQGNVVGQQEAYVDQQGQPVQDESQAFHYRPGDTDTAPRTIFNLRVNPEAQGWSESEGLLWVVDTELVPLSVAKERFPMLADKIRALDGPESSLSYERMIRSAQIQKTGAFTTTTFGGTGKQTDPANLTAVREYWEMRSPYFPKGRLICVVGGAVAYDGPWPQGVFPYAPIFGEPAVLSPFGRAPVSDMVSPQRVINDEWTAIRKQSKGAGVGQWVAWDVPGLPEQIPTQDNAILRIPARSMLANRPIRDVVQRMDPGMVSPDRWKQIDAAKATLFDIGGYHEVSRGQIPPGLDSGVAIQYLLEQETAQVKDAVDSVKESLILWGRHQLAIARWGYADSEGRWLPVDRPDLGFMIESVKGIDLPDPETMGLDIEYFRPQSEAATRAEVKELMGMGVINQRKALQIMDLGGGFEEAFISQTRHYAKARQENLDFERGLFVQEAPKEGPDGQPVGGGIYHVDQDPATGQPVPTDRPFLFPQEDDHAVHIDSHAELALDETQPWPLRQAVLAHMQEHRQVLLAVLTQMAPPPPAGPPAEGPPEQ